MSICVNLDFNMVGLTKAAKLFPASPDCIGQLGLFRTSNETCREIAFEREVHALKLIKTAAVGSFPTQNKPPAKYRKAFSIPHMPKMDVLLAGDLSCQQMTGSMTTLESAQRKVAEMQEKMNQEFEMTAEFHRMMALRGRLIDVDGMQLYDFYDEFGCPETRYEFDKDMNCVFKKMAFAYKRSLPKMVGSGYNRMTDICALVGDYVWECIHCGDEFKCAFERQENGAFLRDGTPWGDVRYAGVNWKNCFTEFCTDADIPEEVRDLLTGIKPNEIVMFPRGIPDMFIRYNAPAETMMSVNTVAEEIYYMADDLPHDRGIQIMGEMNALHMNTMPRAVCTFETQMPEDWEPTKDFFTPDEGGEGEETPKEGGEGEEAKRLAA